MIGLNQLHTQQRDLVNMVMILAFTKGKASLFLRIMLDGNKNPSHAYLCGFL
jgi:hypothetical protein